MKIKNQSNKILYWNIEITCQNKVTLQWNHEIEKFILSETLLKYWDEKYNFWELREIKDKKLIYRDVETKLWHKISKSMRKVKIMRYFFKIFRLKVKYLCHVIIWLLSVEFLNLNK